LAGVLLDWSIFFTSRGLIYVERSNTAKKCVSVDCRN